MLPAHYQAAELRSVGFPQDDTGVVGLSLSAGGAIRDGRYRLTLEEAERTALALLDAVAVQRYRALLMTLQSPISSGSSNSDGSPHEGQPQ